ncbi:MAG: Gfo/Idh/MocA family protein, partial [Blastocatellia bacterium]
MTTENSSRREFISKTTRGAVAAGLTMAAANWNNALGANERVRLGVIGTGNRGFDVMSVFQKEADLQVTALCDCYDKHLGAALEKTEGKAKTFTDYRALLDSKEVDAVLIATPDHWHSRMAIDALNAGKDIYI